MNPADDAVSIDRRAFLKLGALGVGAIAGEATAAAEEPDSSPGALIDVNVSLSRWPFRRLPCDESGALVAMLRRQGVARAWAGSFDALLHRDLAAVNARLAEACRADGGGLLVPFGAVSPKLPDWEEDVRRCHEVHGMPGLRLHPNYHQYTLDDPDFARLLDLADARGLIVQIALMMEDERTQHPIARVPHVDPGPIAEHARRRPGLRIVLINAFRALPPARLGALAGLGNVSFDIAMLEGAGGLANLVRLLPPGRILFGSHAPFFVFESALFKLKESSIDDEPARAIGSGNARRMLGGR